MKYPIYFTAVIEAFSNDKTKSHKFCMDEQGVISVFDPIAGHYTTCHALTEGQEDILRDLAEESVV